VQSVTEPATTRLIRSPIANATRRGREERSLAGTAHSKNADVCCDVSEVRVVKVTLLEGR
jgi:hypothetical protein